MRERTEAAGAVTGRSTERPDRPPLLGFIRMVCGGCRGMNTSFHPKVSFVFSFLSLVLQKDLHEEKSFLQIKVFRCIFLISNKLHAPKSWGTQQAAPAPTTNCLPSEAVTLVLPHRRPLPGFQQRDRSHHPARHPAADSSGHGR